MTPRINTCSHKSMLPSLSGLFLQRDASQCTPTSVVSAKGISKKKAGGSGGGSGGSGGSGGGSGGSGGSSSSALAPDVEDDDQENAELADARAAELADARTAANGRGPMHPTEYGLKPREAGVTVIPFASATELATLRARLANYINHMPEYTPSGTRPVNLAFGSEWQFFGMNPPTSGTLLENESLSMLLTHYGSDVVVEKAMLAELKVKKVKQDSYIRATNGRYYVQSVHANELEIFEPKPHEFSDGGLESMSTFDNDHFHMVEGGFAALANSSSFHNPLVRDIRMAAHAAVIQSMAIPIEDGENFEQIVDRLMVRRSDKDPTAESWHRDEAKFAEDGDTVYGGWVNLDQDRSQIFSMVPYTAQQVKSNKGQGFAALKTHQEILNAIQQSRKVTVPPGHILIFNERTVHEVVARPLKKYDRINADGSPKSGSDLARCRLFFGWRTTKRTTPMTPDLQRRLLAQEALPLKSGQHLHPNPPVGQRANYPGPPPMYSPLHLTNFPLMLKELATHLKPAATLFHLYKDDGIQAGRFPNGLIIPAMFMPSLEKLNEADPTIKLYTPYSEDELKLLTPRRSWTNLKRLDGSLITSLMIA